ncbi:hypothetical protein PV10_01318 [Exophiala mesophila]|uniref:Mitochondrial import inner membrane translocase subunit Tim21 n=1 Tax=Exophiala mesophila TaxID=212818 RepID=A0A0D1YAF7_EXOME|nr:uncharacterized protein PV10_01318 [Exophiala mesophila]KIV97586.1 hypothetical protein PV10_01318 [Exophiala mesophila]
MATIAASHAQVQAHAFQTACRSRIRTALDRSRTQHRLSSSSSSSISPPGTRQNRASRLTPYTPPTFKPRHVASSPFNAHRTWRQASTSSSTSSSASPGTHRRAITVTSDDGRYNWSELSRGEKAARGTQQTFNFLLVSAGAVATLTVFYLLYTELFAPDSVTIQFNQAVSRIKAHPEARALLGPSSKIKAYGEPTSNKWARARPLAHNSEVDRFGTQHFRMHFNVEGPEGRGVVNVHMTKPRGGDVLEYEVLSLNVPGKQTVFVENREAERGVKGKVGKIFGVQWR